MRGSRVTGIVAVCVLAAGASGATARGADWLPPTPEELALRSEPKAPGAPAIILYRQVDRDDQESTEFNYVRIKILTPEGRKYADAEIQYDGGSEAINGLAARVVRPDGTIVDFDGQIYDKIVRKDRGGQRHAKTLTLPDVQVGSIVEYRFRRLLRYGWVFDSHWILSNELYTRHAKFSLIPSGYFTLHYSWPIGLPPGTAPPRLEHGVLLLETRDVPAFVTEEYMPPENELKYRVDFIYDDDPSSYKDAGKFWKRVGKRLYGNVHRVINRRRAMEKAVAGIVDPGDAPEIQLRKIYARVQQIRNISFEPRKTSEEMHREKLDQIDDVEDVWNRDFGSGEQITWLFLALVRAAGLQADPVMVSTRDAYFFNANVANAGQLNTNVVLVRLAGRDLYLDPGTPFTPFGLLPWNETAVRGLRLDEDGGSWVTMPVPPAAASAVERVARLQLGDTGSLQGKLTVTYTGLEAQWRRLEERNEDDADRRHFLEGEVERAVPTGITVALVNVPDWKGSETPLVAEFDLTVPGWATAAGRRVLLAAALFGGEEQHLFEHAPRVHPVYFNFLSRHVDDVRIDLPAGWEVGTIPPLHSNDVRVLNYSLACQATDHALQVRRQLELDTLMLDAGSYGTLMGFFQFVRSSDEDSFVLAPAPAVAKRH